jgi:hypothetical protein
LPQTVLVPVRRPDADPEDAMAALDFGVRHGARLLDTNPDVDLHHMHDANQDELSSSRMAYFRVKWRRLPTAYERFLRERLQPGGPIVLVRDNSSWPVTRVAERHVFQLGAQGGMSAEEYLSAPDVPAPDEDAAEAEWGLSERFATHAREWARRHDHPVVEVSYGHPQDPAAAVADAIRGWLRDAGLPAQRLLVSSFIVHDPWRTLASGSVPFWTFFPVRRAADDLALYLDTASYEEIDVMLFSHGVRSRGLVEAADWEALAGRAGRTGQLLGVNRQAFPADFATFARYGSALGALPQLPQIPKPLDLTVALAATGRSDRMTVSRPHNSG